MSRVPWTRYEGDDIEAVAAMCICRKNPSARRIRPSRGDGGIDVYVPLGDNHVVVYQVKKFAENLTSNQLTQIVIPERGGACQGADWARSAALPTSMWTAPSEGSTSRWSARSVARTNDLDGDPPLGEHLFGESGCGAMCDCGGEVSSVMCMGLGQGRIPRLPVIPSSGHEADMERCAGNTRGQSNPRPRHYGGQTIQRPCACCARGAHATAF